MSLILQQQDGTLSCRVTWHLALGCLSKLCSPSSLPSGQGCCPPRRLIVLRTVVFCTLPVWDNPGGVLPPFRSLLRCCLIRFPAALSAGARPSCPSLALLWLGFISPPGTPLPGIVVHLFAVLTPCCICSMYSSARHQELSIADRGVRCSHVDFNSGSAGGLVCRTLKC